MPRDLVDVASRISSRTGYSDYWIMTGRPRQDSNLQPTDDRTDPAPDQLAVILPFRHPAQP